jgi:hypothetical protein
MTPRQIRHHRAADAFMPRLFAFAYPLHGRPFRWARLRAFVLWAKLFRLYVRTRDI